MSARLATLGPASAEFIDLRPAVEIQGKTITFTIDPQNEIVESDESNNAVTQSVP